MEKKSDSFSDFSLQQAMTLANSDEGQKLFSFLQTTQPEMLQAVMKKAAAGDYTGIKQSMDALFANPEAKKIIQDMKGGSHG